MLIGAKLVVKTLDDLAENKLIEVPQPKVENPKMAYKIFKEDTEIDWSKEAETIYNFIRGMSPYPAAFTILRIGEEQKYLKIFGGIFEKKVHSKSVGEIEISKNSFQIFVKDGVYFPKEVQLEGKKRMNVQDFLNGFQNFENISLVK